ncbi:MAG: hypothetical protein AAF446_04125 [Pseudomonadota bacterium]
MRWLKVLLAWAMAVVTAVLLGSLLQTQFNLAALQALEVPVSLSQRISATWHDWTQFAPLYAILIAITFLIAWLVAGMLHRLWPEWRTAVFVLAGGLSVWALLVIMAGVLPITPIAAARSGTGVAALSLAGGLGGWLYAKMTLEVD